MWALVAALDDVCSQPRPSHAGLRFLRHGGRQVSGAVRLCDHGSGRPPNHAFQYHRHPTAEWTLQQFPETISGEELFRYLIHDRDGIYSRELDCALKAMALRILKTPFRAPQANAYCERLVGSIRRECLDFLIPLNEKHLRRTVKHWIDQTIGAVLTQGGAVDPGSFLGFATGGILAVSHSPRLQRRYQSDSGWLALRIWTRKVRSLKAGHKSRARTYCGSQVVWE
jgi:hypothetical protein